MQVDNNTIALGVVLVIVGLAVSLRIDGAENIANVAIGGVIGFLSGKTTAATK